MNKNEILTIGSIALDTIHTKSGIKENILGGSASYFSLAASYFKKVRMIGVVGDDFPKKYWNLYKNYNINVDNVEIKNGSTFRWGGKYSDDYNSRETLFTELGVFENYIPIIKNPTNNAQFIFLGNIHPEMQNAVMQKTQKEQIIILDTMNLWIDIAYDALIKVLTKVDIFLLNDEEAFLLTDIKNIESAAKELNKLGPNTIIIKKGSYGSYIYDKKNNINLNIPAFPIDKVVDTTGAGDSFAGGFVGKFNGDNIIDSLIHASAIASFTVSKFGVEGLLDIKKKELNKRLEHIKLTMEK